MLNRIFPPFLISSAVVFGACTSESEDTSLPEEGSQIELIETESSAGETAEDATIGKNLAEDAKESSASATTTEAPAAETKGTAETKVSSPEQKKSAKGNTAPQKAKKNKKSAAKADEKKKASKVKSLNEKSEAKDEATPTKNKTSRLDLKGRSEQGSAKANMLNDGVITIVSLDSSGKFTTWFDL